MKKYDHKKIESKWQKVWEDNNSVKIDKDDTQKEKFYLLDMFPYPSGEGLHMGHTEGYTSTDIFYRYKRMKGFNVLHPQGFDSFGLPAENYAIKTGVHPKETTKKNSDNYISQMKSLGLGYDFDEKVVTSDPEYYKWTQWIFTKFFEGGIAYKKTETANWCDSCKTTLANEQVENGACERCKNEVVQKEIPAWFFKITDFADDLIEGLESVDWPEHTKKNQINWIGKSEGAEIDFKISGTDKKFTVFTTRPDTLFGATYCVFAPEHELVEELKESISNWDEVEAYVKETQKKSERERLESDEKTGVELWGIKAINPANGEELPIFIADYVLSGYGTGAIMAVPAHDERDFEFANKFNIPITEVIFGGDIEKEAFSGSGVLMSSGKFDGMESEEAKLAITEFVGGKITSNYRLRDWSVSRQRYWGAPIPIVYDPEGVAHAVPEEHLPWTLPEDVDFVPTGTAPLAQSKELKERTENIFDKGWIPEVDTMDTFVDSSWYFLRYPDPHNEKEFVSKERLESWMPVDLYIGGAEHTYMHLLYARFFTRAMHKLGMTSFDEPFMKLRHQGMVLDKSGVKMSKSKGNVISPNEMVERFGADSVRTYMMFAGPLEDDVMWNENNIVGVYRFLEKVWKLQERVDDDDATEYVALLHKTIKKVGEDIETLDFNTAISQMMILVNEMSKSDVISRVAYESLLKVLAPFAPHIAEELWHELGHEDSIHLESWPEYDAGKTKDESITIVIQVNGKVRGDVEVLADEVEDVVKEKALAHENVGKWIGEKDPKKVIYIKNKLINIVI